MRSYESLAKLTEALSGIDESEQDAAYRECWRQSAQLVEGIESDLAGIAGGKPRVRQLEFRICNPDHHGADTFLAVVRYDDWDVFQVDVSGLITQGSITLSVRRRPNNVALEPIANKLDLAPQVNLKKFFRNGA
jgi:hypothetical protein